MRYKNLLLPMAIFTSLAVAGCGDDSADAGTASNAAEVAAFEKYRRAPSLTLSAAPTTVSSGTSTTLSWSSAGATACAASGAWTGTLALTGARGVAPQATAGYTVTCRNSRGRTSRSVSVSVTAAAPTPAPTPPPTPAPVVVLEASAASLTSGTALTLTWSSTNATSCSASGGWTGTKSVSGIASLTPSATANYTLTCTGAGGSRATSTTVTVTAAPPPPAPDPTPAPPPAPAAAELQLTPCEPQSGGRDFQVGPGSGQLASLADVPWETLRAGDTVRIFARSTPYAGKFLVSAKGTASAPVRVCGVRGSAGERPVITGNGAVTRRGTAYGNPIHEQRGIIMVKSLNTESYTNFPTYIQIDGLKIQSATPAYTYTDTNGAQQRYMDFGGCIWVERGHNVVIADNEITDCTHAIFSRSNEEGEFAVTRNLRIAGNYMHNNGVAGSYTIHNTYVQSAGVIYEFNRYGALRTGATGNSLKDRSTGVVIRYNRIEDGARAIDLVEAEDFASVATVDPAYRSTYVYGNQITKDGRKGSTIHYGGDHPGSESNYRKGTLYFYNNTVHISGNDYAVLFQLSTTEEKAEVWNNVFTFDPAIQYPSMRATQDNAPGIPSGGIVNLGRNWIVARWADSDPYHPVPGQLNGSSNMITGVDLPIELPSMVPLAGSPVLGVATAQLAAVAAHPVRFQLDTSFRPVARPVVGVGSDLGAIER